MQEKIIITLCLIVVTRAASGVFDVADDFLLSDDVVYCVKNHFFIQFSLWLGVWQDF